VGGQLGGERGGEHLLRSQGDVQFGRLWLGGKSGIVVYGSFYNKQGC